MYVCMYVSILRDLFFHRSFGKKTIVFYETKKDAHRFCKAR